MGLGGKCRRKGQGEDESSRLESQVPFREWDVSRLSQLTEREKGASRFANHASSLRARVKTPRQDGGNDEVGDLDGWSAQCRESVRVQARRFANARERRDGVLDPTGPQDSRLEANTPTMS